MDAVLQVLHELVNIVHGHGLPKGRADELHDILNGVTEVLQDAGKAIDVVTGPEAPAVPGAKA